MFWFLAISSMLGYSIQGVLVAKYARKIDAASCVIYRNISLGISMLPLLFFSSKTDFLQIQFYWKEFLLGGIFGGAGVLFSFSSIKHIPIGINAAVSSSIRTILLIIIGIIIFHEKISIYEYLFIGVILFCVVLLSTIKYTIHNINTNVLKGVIYASIAGLLLSIWMYLAANVSRNLNPYIAGYFFEVAIGIVFVLIVILRYLFMKKPIEKISLKNFRNILLASSPTLIGTGGYAIATTIGRISIVSIIGVSSIFVVTILSHFIYKEKLKLIHWIIIFIVMFSIIGLKLTETV